MPPESHNDVKAQVKQATDIVELVGGYLQLRREGRNFKALCPWHDDTRPSLHVNPQRQSFKCWVCDIGGDVFEFVMRIEKVEFREALALLAERAGVALAPRAPGGQPPDGKQRLYQAMAWAQRELHECLLSAREAEPARRYLDERGITDDSIRRFGLGFSPPEWEWLVDRGARAGYSHAELEAAGLAVRRSGGARPYDRFRGRVLFPIRDTHGRPVAIGGRVLPQLAEPNTPKYINSPETPLFSKSALLYALDAARDAASRAGETIVMEGYTDVILAHQFGFTNAVAVLGTALGERHVKLLRRFADRVVLVLDGDEAGRRRAGDVLELFVAEQLDLRIVTLPSGLDPADFLLAHGADALARLLARAADALSHAFEDATAGVDPNDVHQMQQALERMLSVLAKAPRLAASATGEARLREQKVIERLAFRFRVPEEDVRARLVQLRRRAPRRDAQAGAAAGRRPDIALWERQLLELLLQAPQQVAEARAEIRPEDLPSPRCRAIVERASAIWDAGGTPDFHRLLLEFDDSDVKGLLVEIDERAPPGGGEDAPERLATWLASFRDRRQQRQGRAQAESLRQPALSDDQQQRLLEQIIEQRRSRQGISVPTDG